MQSAFEGVPSSLKEPSRAALKRRDKQSICFIFKRQGTNLRSAGMAMRRRLYAEQTRWLECGWKAGVAAVTFAASLTFIVTGVL